MPETEANKNPHKMSKIDWIQESFSEHHNLSCDVKDKYLNTYC